MVTLDPVPTTSLAGANDVDSSVAHDMAASTSFLYTGDNPVQTGVSEGTIKAEYAAVIRGKVADRQGVPIVGVTISVLHHAEFGETHSREDGVFDIAVNGGGPLIVTYEKSGFLPIQRQIDVPWQDYVLAPEVVLITLDPTVTTIDLAHIAVEPSVARGSVVSDSDGTRQATVLFPPGVSAQLVSADGVTQTI